MWTLISLTCMRCRAGFPGASQLTHWGAVPNGLKGLTSTLRDGRARSGHLPRQGGSWNIEEGIPDLDLLWRLLKNPEEGFLGSFLGLPKESFTATFDPSGDFWKSAMASRGRRGGAPAREDEPRRDERAEQQAPAPQGPVLPPPPPVDYGVFMQGLTQAHTQAALQAQLEAQERADIWWASLLRTRFEDGAIDVAWDEFVRLFRAKYVPEHVQDRME
ncbi:hypothetical protein Taro_012000 [Colocasia esculenta]|uniref:Retrotransposon gag domain-containing protein n=1 Tax=Colocasia esculenta TaxID=4460 RepID=A0A843U7U0_COLES|nr:hypothetical protein [Colocasia esculenta]